MGLTRSFNLDEFNRMRGCGALSEDFLSRTFPVKQNDGITYVIVDFITFLVRVAVRTSRVGPGTHINMVARLVDSIIDAMLCFGRPRVVSGGVADVIVLATDRHRIGPPLKKTRTAKKRVVVSHVVQNEVVRRYEWVDQFRARACLRNGRTAEVNMDLIDERIKHIPRDKPLNNFMVEALVARLRELVTKRQTYEVARDTYIVIDAPIAGEGGDYMGVMIFFIPRTTIGRRSRIRELFVTTPGEDAAEAKFQTLVNPWCGSKPPGADFMTALRDHNCGEGEILAARWMNMAAHRSMAAPSVAIISSNDFDVITVAALQLARLDPALRAGIDVHVRRDRSIFEQGRSDDAYLKSNGLTDRLPFAHINSLVNWIDANVGGRTTLERVKGWAAMMLSIYGNDYYSAHREFQGTRRGCSGELASRMLRSSSGVVVRNFRDRGSFESLMLSLFTVPAGASFDVAHGLLWFSLNYWVSLDHEAASRLVPEGVNIARGPPSTARARQKPTVTAGASSSAAKKPASSSSSSRRKPKPRKPSGPKRGRGGSNCFAPPVVKRRKTL